ncbi:MAG TPA: alanine dehydrogenase [Anaerolineae bacterium]|nr:alanine dehydrogenase [Anaerolineae bacterium]
MTTFGLPREIRPRETRVGLTPAGVTTLTQAGHTVYVETDAGAAAGFSNEAYANAGANIVYSPAEIYGRATIVVKIARPTADEHNLFRSQQIICSFLNLAVASHDLFDALVEHEITALDYEMVTEEDQLPLLTPISEIAGRLAPLIAGHLLMHHHGGRGTLLSGLPGVPPGAVVILGGGVVGTNAARAFRGLGAQVTVIDASTRQLQQIDHLFQGQITTMFANEYNINRALPFADVIIGAPAITGTRAPTLITRDHLTHMRPGAVFIDYAISQGGCAQTSRPTTLRDPTYQVENVIHYCVPNITAAVPRTASYALTNAVLPYLLALGQHGLPTAIIHQPSLQSGINTYQGHLVHPRLAAALGQPLTPWPQSE